SLVLYDGDCRLCRKSVALLKRLDWLGRLEFADSRGELPEGAAALDRERLLEEMHALTPNRRRVFHGFGAFRWIAWQLPLTWALVPLLYVPGCRRWGSASTCGWRRTATTWCPARTGAVPCR